MTFPLPPTPAFLGTSLLGLGILRLVAPQPAYKLFGLPLAPTEQPSPFIYSIAGRDLALGVAYILLGLKGDRTGVWGLVVGTVVCIYISFLDLRGLDWCGLCCIWECTNVVLECLGRGASRCVYYF
jgi:hypothetical protein